MEEPKKQQSPDDLEQQPRRKRRGPKGAKEKCMDYLARREHSELELRTKLHRLEKYTSQDIEEAIEWIKENNWLPDPFELAERVAANLHAKYKGYLYIRSYLQRKGLPQVDKDREVEENKAFEWAENRYGTKITKSDMEKLIRQLRSRGFEEETLRKVYYDKR